MTSGRRFDGSESIVCGDLDSGGEIASEMNCGNGLRSMLKKGEEAIVAGGLMSGTGTAPCWPVNPTKESSAALLSQRL